MVSHFVSFTGAPRRAAGDVKFVDAERHPRLRADDDGWIDADGGGDFQTLLLFLGFQNHPAQMMIRRRPERKPVLAEHQHAVDGKIANAGVGIFADLHADGDVGAAVFARVGDDRQLGQIDLIAGPFDFLARRGR